MRTEMEPRQRIILPLDVESVQAGQALVTELAPHVGPFKIGLEFIHAMLTSLITASDGALAHYIADSVRQLFRLLDGRIFWDGKFDDIPNTVAGASAQVAKLGVRMFNVHASAGRAAVEQAVAKKGNSLVLGVSVLTSIDPAECQAIFGRVPELAVCDFARMLADVGADGVICSPQELEILSQQPWAEKLLKVVPGVRPTWAAAGDQRRVMTPAEAIRAGADYLVIGRPITKPPAEIGGSVKAAKLIAEEIAQAMG